MINEDYYDQTQSKTGGEDTFDHDDDTVHTSEIPLQTSKPIPYAKILKSSNPLLTPPESDVFENILQ